MREFVKDIVATIVKERDRVILMQSCVMLPCKIRCEPIRKIRAGAVFPTNSPENIPGWAKAINCMHMPTRDDVIACLVFLDAVETEEIVSRFWCFPIAIAPDWLVRVCQRYVI